MYKFYYIKQKIEIKDFDKFNSNHIFHPFDQTDKANVASRVFPLMFSVATGKLDKYRKIEPWQKMDFDYCSFIWSAANEEGVPPTVIVCDEVNKISIIATCEPNFFGNYNIGITDKKIAKTSSLENWEMDLLTIKCQSDVMKLVVNKLIKNEKDSSFLETLSAIGNSTIKSKPLTVKEASLIIWRLNENKIEHNTDDLLIDIVTNKDSFPFEGLKQWQFDRLYPYLRETDKIMYGYLRTEYSEDLFDFFK